MDDESSIEQQWAVLNGDQAASNSPSGFNDRVYLQREQDHFGFIVVGAFDQQAAEPGDVIEGIHIGLDRVEAPDLKLKVVGLSTAAEWREHTLFLFGPSVLAEFDFCISCRDYWIVRAIAE